MSLCWTKGRRGDKLSGLAKSIVYNADHCVSAERESLSTLQLTQYKRKSTTKKTQCGRSRHAVEKCISDDPCFDQVISGEIWQLLSDEKASMISVSVKINGSYEF